jgi:transcriptional regulator with XRE-family HTH domain
MNDEKKPGKMEQKEQFIELRAAGFSFADIAEKMGVSKPTLIGWSRGLDLEIQNARSLRLDELFQRYAVGKEKRVEAFGKRLDLILAELDKRDLAGLETDKLLTLALKFGESLRGEYEPLTLAERRVGPHLDFLDELKTWQA